MTSPPPTVPSAPGLKVDRVLDGVHAAVGEQGVDAARMVTARGDGGVGRPAVVLVFGAHVAVDGRRPGGRLCVGGQGRGETVVERVAVAPVGMAAARHARGRRRELASRRRGRGDAREHGRNVGVRRRPGRARAAGPARSHGRLGVYVLTSAPSIVLLSPSVNEANLRLTLEPNARRVRPAAGEAAEGVPGSLAPAVVGDAVGAGHAGGASCS